MILIVAFNVKRANEIVKSNTGMDIQRVPKGGDERTGFLHALSVFCWVPLSCGCPSRITVYPGCVSVLLHLPLHAF